ncbi:MAG: GntR family transcriptional regulator [Candidatus Cryptobacteroides sp.]
MPLNLNIIEQSLVPSYKQIINQIEDGIRNGSLKSGEMLPSMNELAASLGISKETVKKAYSMLRDQGTVDSTRGIGYFIAAPESNRKKRILLLFDKLSNLKQVLFDSFASAIADRAEINIYLHNQQVELLDYYVRKYLESYDWFVITPHFPLDSKTQRQVLTILRRIPNRKLVILDHKMDSLPGNYGCVYQDYAEDAYIGLGMATEELKEVRQLNVIISQSSLYHKFTCGAVEKFCKENNIRYSCYNKVTPDMVHQGEVYLILNGQLDMELIHLVRAAKSMGLKPGKDFRIIAYNDSPVSEIILDGLTTISTDFEQMGRIAAEMILKNEQKRIKCDFRLTRRSTF